MLTKVLLAVVPFFLVKTILNEEYDKMPDLFDYDDFDKCLFESPGINSIYCSVTVELFPINSINSSQAWNIVDKVSSNPEYYRHDLLRHGICLNQLFKFDEPVLNYLNKIYAEKYKSLGLIGTVIDHHCERTKSTHNIKTEDIIFLVVCAIYIIFVISVTLLKRINRNKNCGSQTNSFVEKYLSSFCAIDNFQKVFSTESINISNYDVVLQGFRSVLACYGIMMHVLMQNLLIPVGNPVFAEELVQIGASFFLGLASGGLQAFFVLSAWFMALSYFRSSKSKQTIGFDYVIKNLFKRYVRFSPLYFFILGLHCTSWVVRFARGPFSEKVLGLEHIQCKKYWWTGIFYVSNFYLTDGTCLLHTWYLSADMQLTLIGLMILWLSQRSNKKFLILTGLLLVFQIVFFFNYLYWNHFEFLVAIRPEFLYNMELVFSKEVQANWTYTFSSLSSISIGFYLAYIHHNFNNKCFSSSKMVILWYFVTMTLMFGSPAFISYYLRSSHYGNNILLSAALGSVFKTVIGFGFGLFILGLVNGQGGFIKKFLGWKPMHTLGQLSFGVYLIHYQLLKMTVGSRKSLMDMSIEGLVYDFLINTVLAFSLSAFFTIFLVMPFDGFVKKFI